MDVVQIQFFAFDADTFSCKQERISSDRNKWKNFEIIHYHCHYLKLIINY